jgi:undecaprenyl-diphosphatase
MNEMLIALILAIVQGITEWLPISSSGHLVLFEHFFDYKPGLMFDVALHFGTLMAVFVYFGKDIVDIIRDLLRLDFKSDNGRTGLLLIIATIPAAVMGYLFEKVFVESFSSLLLVGFGFAITGVSLLIASIDWKGKNMLTLKGAVVVGFAQVVSIFPGISRSGSTLSVGMILGLSPKAAARFSFLLAVPIIFGASILTIGNNVLPSSLIWATLVAFLVGLLVIHFMFKKVLTSRENLRWFAAYAIFLSIFVIFYSIFISKGF